MRAYLVQQVVSDWPLTLQEWDLQQAEFADIEKRRKLPGSGNFAFADLVPEPVTAILFAYEFGCPEILPAAYYRLANIDVLHDFDARNGESCGNVPMAKWTLADGNILRHLLQGQSSINLWADGYIENAAIDLTALGCGDSLDDLNDSPCCLTFRRLIAVVWGTPETRYDDLRLLLDCLDYENHLEYTWELVPGLRIPKVPQICSECQESLHRWVERERSESWDHLKDAFRLG